MSNQSKITPTTIILSGGLDSTTLLYSIYDEMKLEHGSSQLQEISQAITAITIQYGQRHTVEIEKAKITAKLLGINHEIIDLSAIATMLSKTSSLLQTSDIDVPSITEIIGNPQPSTYVPYRNLLMLSIAASISESNNSNTIYIGVQAQDLYSYFDTTSEFINSVNDVLALNRHHELKVIAPYAHMSKSQIVKEGIAMGVPYINTHTCYSPTLDESGDPSKAVSCGVCGSCAERIQAFKNNDVEDPIDYQIEIDW